MNTCVLNALTRKKNLRTYWLNTMAYLPSIALKWFLTELKIKPTPEHLYLLYAQGPPAPIFPFDEFLLELEPILFSIRTTLSLSESSSPVSVDRKSVVKRRTLFDPWLANSLHHDFFPKQLLDRK